MVLTSSDSDTSVTDTSVLEVSDLRVRLGGAVALTGISFEVPSGRVVSLVGPPGAGKTTLVKAVCGYVRPEAGAISWHGAPLRPRPHRMSTLGLPRTLQGIGLHGGLTVLENVMVGAAGVPPVPAVPPGRGVALLGRLRAARDRVDLRSLALHCLDRLGLGAHVDADPATVTEELRDRVVLAGALVADPELLVLDEPTAGLDPTAATGFVELVTRGGRSGAVLLTSRDADLAGAVANTVVHLDRGSVVPTSV